MNKRQEMIVAIRQYGREFLEAAVPLLEGQVTQAKGDLYQPVADEVLGGLLARVFRLLQVMLIGYHLWAEDLSRMILRCMIESIFYMKFLVGQDSPEAYLDFQRYGIGQEKLYKMQLRKLLEEGKLKGDDALRRWIDSESDEEIWDELVKVDLKSFANLHKLAADAGMEDEYAAYYQPFSIVEHGQWPALRDHYLIMCEEPLHRGHLVPTFVMPALNPALIERSFDFFEAAYGVWIDRYGLDDLIAPLAEKYFESCMAYVQSQNAPGQPSEGGEELAS